METHSNERHLDDIIPLAADGEMDEMSLAMVRAKARSKPEVMAELLFYERLRDEIKNAPLTPPPPLFFENALSRLHGRLPGAQGSSAAGSSDAGWSAPGASHAQLEAFFEPRPTTRTRLRMTLIFATAALVAVATWALIALYPWATLKLGKTPVAGPAWAPRGSAGTQMDDPNLRLPVGPYVPGAGIGANPAGGETRSKQFGALDLNWPGTGVGGLDDLNSVFQQPWATPAPTTVTPPPMSRGMQDAGARRSAAPGR